MLHPVMPKTTDKIATALGCELLADFTIEKIPPLFPRIEEQLLKEVEKSEKPKVEKKSKKEDKVENKSGIITIDEFFKTELKIGTIIEAEEVPKSKKLLKLKVDLGEENPRQHTSLRCSKLKTCKINGNVKRRNATCCQR